MDRTISLAQAGKSYHAGHLRLQIDTDIQTIFSNFDICSNLLSVSGTDFHLGSMIQVGTKYRNQLEIDELKVVNPVTQSDASILADFHVVGHLLSDPNKQVTSVTRAYYRYSGLNVDLCRIEITPQQACANLELTWDTLDTRCQICEPLGGTWFGGKCVL